MKLYHYSVDSYRGDGKLTNDYKKNYRFAEPYLLALRESRELFTSVFLSTMYMSRELTELKLRKYENYQKDAVEGIFEYVRETRFPEEPSRLSCVYYCRSKEEAVSYAMEDCIDCGLFTKDQVARLELEVDEKRVREYDQAFFNEALEAITERRIERVFDCAVSYYARERTAEPLIEVVSDGDNTVLRRLDY